MMQQAKPYRGPKKGQPPNRGLPISVAEFKSLWHDMGIPMSAIASRLGVTERTVSVRAKTFGFTPRTALRGAARSTFDDEFPAFWVFGVSVYEMAKHYKVTPGAVYMRAWRSGMSAQGRDLSKHDRGRSIADYRAVKMASAMARSAAVESRVAKEYWAAA